MWKKNMLKNCEVTGGINEKITLINETNFFSTDTKAFEETVQEIQEHNYACDICKETITVCDSFADHLQKHNGDTFDRCTVCGQSFKNKFYFYKHIIVHLKETPQACKICCKTYMTWLKLKYHLVWHDKTFQCHLCDKTFADKKNLDNHLLIHTEEEYNSCKICSQLGSVYVCIQSAALPKKPHTCKICGKIFWTKKSLSAHQRMHKNNGPFSNKLCLKDFVLKTNFTSHLSSSHSEASIKIVIRNSKSESN